MSWRVVREVINSVCGRVISDTFSVRCITLVLGLSVCLFLNACPGALGDLYVRIDREDERFVGSAPSGVMNIDWIQFDSLYEFRLYAKKRSKLLASLTVTRDD